MMVYGSAACALCDALLTPENDSFEHVILNALGGRLKAPGILCRNCNNKSGHDWDSTLADQLSHLALFFGITRDQGEVQSRVLRSASGTELLATSTGLTLAKPVVTRLENGNFRIQARTIDEARKIVRGLAKKYPGVDVDKALQDVENTTSYPSEPIVLNLQTGGAESGRSIVKSALILAVMAGVNPKACEEARQYLGGDGEPAFGYFYERDLISNRPSDRVFHCVAVRSSSNGLLLEYVELYGLYRMVVCLSRSYQGNAISHTYAVDPVTGLEIDLQVDLEFSEDKINDIYNYKCIPDDRYRQAFESVMPLGIKLSVKKERDRLIERAFQGGWETFGAKDGEVITQDHIVSLSRVVAEQMTPFLVHLHKLGIISSFIHPLRENTSENQSESDKPQQPS